MGFFNKKGNESVEETVIKAPKDHLLELFQTASGTGVSKDFKHTIYNNIVGFKGVSSGVGTSTIVSGVALALAKTGLSVCVLDTSIMRPSQELYLQGVRPETLTEDWFDFPFTNKNILVKSKLDLNVHILGFRNRDVSDLCSTNDDESLVELAFREINKNFDVILVDISNEPTSISAVSMQKCHQVVNVVSNDVVSLNSLEGGLTNNLVLSCLMDKMRYVVTSKVCEDIKVDWKTLLAKYKLVHLTGNVLSTDIIRIMASGGNPYNYPEKSEGIESFTDSIHDIAVKILGLEVDNDVPDIKASLVDKLATKKRKLKDDLEEKGIVEEEGVS